MNRYSTGFEWLMTRVGRLVRSRVDGHYFLLCREGTGVAVWSESKKKKYCIFLIEKGHPGKCQSVFLSCESRDRLDACLFLACTSAPFI